MEKTVVVSVNTIGERDIIIRNISNQIENLWSEYYELQQDRVNRLKIFHREEGHIPDHLKSPVCTYVVVVIPILTTTSSLNGFTGYVDFRLENTINSLRKLLRKFELLHGRKTVKENIDTRAFEELIRSLS